MHVVRAHVTWYVLVSRVCVFVCLVCMCACVCVLFFLMCATSGEEGSWWRSRKGGVMVLWGVWGGVRAGSPCVIGGPFGASLRIRVWVELGRILGRGF